MKLSIKRIPAVTPGSVLNAAFSKTDESRNKSLENGGGGDARYEEKSKLAFYFAPKHVVAFLFDQKISNFTSNVRALCATGPDMTNDEWMNENLHRHQTTQNLTMKLTLMYAQNVDFTIYFIFICFLPFLEPPLKNSAKTTEDVFFLDLFMEKCPIPLEVSRLVAIQNKRYNKAFVLKVKVCHLFYFYGVEIILLPRPLFHTMKERTGYPLPQKLEAGFEEGLASSVLDETTLQKIKQCISHCREDPQPVCSSLALSFSKRQIHNFTL